LSLRSDNLDSVAELYTEDDFRLLCSGAAICLIIPCSSAPTLSNNIIQKGLAFGRDWSGSVINSGR
jgi:hypothetical protein